MKGDLIPVFGAEYAPTASATPVDSALNVSLSDRWRALGWFLALLALAVASQFLVGAYGVELGNSSDESAHFMNALLVRDYLWNGVGTNPFTFAESYYLSYPKIAPLMWPPFFHGSLGVFLLPGWAPHQAALVLVALFTATAAFRLSRFVSLVSSNFAAIVIPLLFVITPAIVNVSTAIMVDIALVALGLEATWWLTRYFVTGEPRHAMLFGLFAACCCLTKGNGVAITLLPALLILGTGRLHLLRTRGLYLAALIVAVFAGPFVYISYRLCEAMGDFTGTGGLQLLARLELYVRFLWQQLTPVPFVLAIIGAAGAVYRAWTWAPSPRSIAPAALVAFAGAVLMFHTLLPLTFYSGRYIVMSVAPLLGLVPLGATTLLRLGGYNQTRYATGVVGIAALSLLLLQPAISPRLPLGFATTINALGTEALANRRLLVISDESGEGALVSEIALRAANPRPTVIRGSKLLIDGDWMDNHLQTLFSTSESTLKRLEDLHVDYVVFDRSAAAQEMPYWAHMNAVVNDDAGDRLKPVYAIEPAERTGPTRGITVYRLTQHTPGSPAKLRVNLRYSIGRVLEK